MVSVRRILLATVGAFILITLPQAAMGASATLDFEDAVYGIPGDSCANNPDPPFFNRPERASQTAAYIVDPTGCGEGVCGGTNGSDSYLSNDFSTSGTNSNEIRFSWVDPTDDDSWLRLITFAAGGDVPNVQNPTVYLGEGGKISMEISTYATLGSEGVFCTPAFTTEGLEFSLLIRETGANLPLGEDGGNSGPIEFVGVTGKGGSVDPSTPVGGVELPHTGFGSFTTVVWEFLDDDGSNDGVVDTIGVTVGANPQVKLTPGVEGFTGDSILSAANDRGTLDGIAIRKPVADDTAVQWFVYIDDIVIEAPNVTDPVLILGPVSNLDTAVTITNIDTSATEVKLFINGNLVTPTATSPPEDFSDGEHTFTGLSLSEGDILTATQVVSTVEGDPSNPVTVQAGTCFEDFSGGVTAFNDPGSSGQFGVWYDVTGNTFGTPSGGTLDGSPAMQIVDGGFTNGVYAIYEMVVPANGTYHLTCDMHITEDSSLADSIDQYQVGVVVNGVHRTGGGNLPAIDDAQVDQGIGEYAGLTTGDDSALPTQTVSTTSFTANAGDNILVAFSTDVESGNWNGSSAAWGTAVVLVDNLCLQDGEPCFTTPPVTITEPLVIGATDVTVTGIDPTATEVNLYIDGSLVDTAVDGVGGADFSDGEHTFTGLSLGANETVIATQVVGGVEGCEEGGVTVSLPVPSLGTPIIVGDTTVEVNDIDASATDVNIYVDGILDTTITAAPPSMPAVTLTGGALSAFQEVQVSQVIGGDESPLSAPVTVIGNPVGNLRIAMRVSEVAATGPVANPGSVTTPYEHIGDTGTFNAPGGAASAAPQGKLLAPGSWTPMTFDNTDPVNAWVGGDGLLNSPTDPWYVLAGLAIAIDKDDPRPGPYEIFIDDVANMGTTFGEFEDPPYVVGTDEVLFRTPQFSGTTNGNVDNATDATVISATEALSGTQSNLITFEFIDSAPDRWIRLSTFNSPFLPAPEINLGAGEQVAWNFLVCGAPDVSIGGPLAAGQSTVTVTDVSPAASGVTVYSFDGVTETQIGTALGNRTDTVTVNVSPSISAGDQIYATQTIEGSTGCIPTSGALVGDNENSGIKLALGVREADSSIEWIGASTAIDGAPQGKTVSVSPNWQTVEFDLTDSLLGFTGDGAIADPANLILEHVAISIDSASGNTGPYTLYIDNVVNDVTTIEDFETAGLGTQVLFRQPRFSGTTLDDLLTAPDVSEVVDTQADASVQSNVVEWQWVDATDQRWIRLTTDGFTPAIDLTAPKKLTLRVLLLPAVVCNDPVFDADGDSDVDNDDFGAFQRCVTEGTGDPIAAGCECFDWNGDGDIDIVGTGGGDIPDLGKFIGCSSGPAIPASTTCDD